MAEVERDGGAGLNVAAGFRTGLHLFVVGVHLAFAWEMLQAPAFTGMPDRWLAATAECAQAAVGDSVIVLGLFATGALAFRDVRWFRPARAGRYAALIGAGMAVQVVMEWIMVYGAGRWGYGADHPVLPLLGVGLLPVLQAVVLFPLVFWLTAIWEARAERSI